MPRRPLLLLVALGLAALPQPAWANAGTPLMWAGMLHLVFGNALLGVLEGLLLAWAFRVPRIRAVLVMIAANYLSAWLGGWLLGRAIVAALPLDLNNGWQWFWRMVAVMYGLTLLLEWPFVAWAMRGGEGWLQRSVRASLVIQTLSYGLLFGWYWMASGTSLYTGMQVVAPAALALPESVVVYYISPADGDVYRRGLAGGAGQKVYELRSAHDNDRLFVSRTAGHGGRWDLMARLETEDRGKPRFVEVLAGLPVEAPRRSEIKGRPEVPAGNWLGFGEVPALAGAADSPWKIETGFWPTEGLWAVREQTGERVHLSYETPFGAWAVRNAVHLPTDKALFQLGRDQICGFDPAARRVALLWRGRGPVAVIEKGIADRAVR